MKTIAMVMPGLMLYGGAALADIYVVSASERFLECALTDFAPFPEQTQAFVIHGLNAGSAASQFAIVDASGMVFAGFTSPYLTLGNLADISIAHGSCVPGDHVLLVLNWFVFPEMQFSCENTIRIVAAPTSPLPGEIVTILCDFTFEVGNGFTTWVGPDAAACSPCASNCFCPHAVAAMTWGGIKALYR